MGGFEPDWAPRVPATPAPGPSSSQVASEDTIHWPSILDAWKALGYCDPILSTWKGGTRDAYASHLRRLAQIGGRTAWSDAQRVVELALFQMFKMGFRKATLRGCVSAVKACVVLG